VLLKLANVLFCIETKAFFLGPKNWIPDRAMIVAGMGIVVKPVFTPIIRLSSNLHLVPRLQYHVKSAVAR
jgi:energy-converting hydrogenase Eha subunit G